ncbi:hypothetical protein ES703_94708 [subsurface metagenome]
MVSGKGNRLDFFFTEFFIQALNKCRHPLFYFAKMAVIWEFVNDLPLIVDHDTINADRTGINAYV